jgi:hypothetical protein
MSGRSGNLGGRPAPPPPGRVTGRSIPRKSPRSAVVGRPPAPGRMGPSAPPAPGRVGNLDPGSIPPPPAPGRVGNVTPGRPPPPPRLGLLGRVEGSEVPLPPAPGRLPGRTDGIPAPGSVPGRVVGFKPPPGKPCALEPGGRFIGGRLTAGRLKLGPLNAARLGPRLPRLSELARLGAAIPRPPPRAPPPRPPPPRPPPPRNPPAKRSLVNIHAATPSSKIHRPFRVMVGPPGPGWA